MTSQANTLTTSSRVTANLLIWWQSLTDDDQDLLRVTHSLLPHEPYLHALLAHESQFESTMKAVDPLQLTAFRERIAGRLEQLGAAHGVGSAELFKLITDL